MKEIKFRAWNKKNKKMQYSGIVWGITNLNYPALTGLNDFGDIDNLSDLMQYIGLKDKNGKEIYEGDIFIHKFQTWKKSKVVFFKGAFCYEDKYMDIDTHYFAPDAQFIEVVGNIYENPELIK